MKHLTNYSQKMDTKGWRSMKRELSEATKDRFYSNGNTEDFTAFAGRISNELRVRTGRDMDCLPRSITVQVTDACNLCCSYCYQINKSTNVLSLENAKKFIDLILTDDDSINSHISQNNADMVILDFIGGEPLLQIDLVDQITDYFIKRMIELDHPWLPYYQLTVGTNGTLYFDPRVQKYIKKHIGRLSFNITVDGNKRLHDACRIFPDGSGSYDMAIAAAKDWVKVSGMRVPSTKLTIAPGNVEYLSEAIIDMMNNGFVNINENCVYEEGWTLEHAKILYRELKKIADYVLEYNLETSHTFRIFNPDWYTPMNEDDDQNWCGGDGRMLAVDVHGDLFNCIRYMESSLGTDIEPLTIGNVDRGIGITEKDKQNLHCMQCITRRSQSTDECFHCPIATGCGWCTGYNYQKFGTCNKRSTYICVMQKASSLANVYYWNSIMRKHNIDERVKMHCPKEWAVPIIGENEYDMLLELSKEGE